MSRLTMEGNSSMQGGMSRIPRFAPSNRGMLQTNMFNNQQPLPGVGSGQKPSRLQQMQMDYQKNMMKQKEEKLINMYEDQQKRALQKVNQNRGMVREFFDERRAHSGSSVKSVAGPTMDQLYNRKKQEFRYGQSGGYSNVSSRTNSGSRYGQDIKSNPEVINRNMGRDRSKPLAPIQPNNGNTDNPFARRKAQIVRPKTYKDQPKQRDYSNNVAMPRSAPNGFHNENYDDDLDDSPPPNNDQLQHLQQKRKMLQDQRLSNKALTEKRNPPPPTRKTPQSNRNYEYEPSEDEDEGYDDVNDHSGGRTEDDEVKRKQQELMEQIQSQQRELERLRQERELAEQEERKERERRKRVEEERRRQMAEEERRRQKEEEDERIRQQWEEEKQKKMEMEKRRMRDTSRNSNISGNESRNTNHYNNHSPTPPPQPRPNNTRKVVPNKPPQKQRVQQPQQPVVSGDHTALYEQAGNIDGAYEDTGRLASCRICGRRFAEDRLAKHEKACKTATKKRKALDPSKLRTRGTEMEQFVAHRQPTPPKAKKKKDWRAQHESFIQAIRYAKKAKAIEESGGNLADLPPPPPTENPDYVQCPHCSRKFNETAAERHIPHCKKTVNRPKPPPGQRRR